VEHMKTESIKKSEIKKEWWIADAEGQTLGRFASKIATILKGKHKPNYTPNMDMGDFVIVVNADKVRVSGNKETKKTYFRHTGYPGGTKTRTLSEMRNAFPERIVEQAVKGMLPHNRLGRALYTHLKVYTGNEHPHSAQNPKPMEF